MKYCKIKIKNKINRDEDCFLSSFLCLLIFSSKAFILSSVEFYFGSENIFCKTNNAACKNKSRPSQYCGGRLLFLYKFFSSLLPHFYACRFGLIHSLARLHIKRFVPGIYVTYRPITAIHSRRMRINHNPLCSILRRYVGTPNLRPA